MVAGVHVEVGGLNGSEGRKKLQGKAVELVSALDSVTRA